jgi:hypothetical protein
MHDICTYLIELQGLVEEKDLIRMSPSEIVVVQESAATTQLTIRADQSGLIGLLRYLHGRGFVLLSITHKRS